MNDDNDTVDTSDKETSGDENSDEIATSDSTDSHQEKVIRLAKQNAERRKHIFNKTLGNFGEKLIQSSQTNQFETNKLIIDLETSNAKYVLPPF